MKLKRGMLQTCYKRVLQTLQTGVTAHARMGACGSTKRKVKKKVAKMYANKTPKDIVQMALQVKNHTIESYVGANEEKVVIERMCWPEDLSLVEKMTCCQIVEQNRRELGIEHGTCQDIYPQLFNVPTTRFVLTRINDEICAFAQYEFILHRMRLPVVFIHNIHVRHDDQRTGIGQYMVKTLELLGRSYKMRYIQVKVFCFNADAVVFFIQKMKFQIDLSDNSSSWSLKSSRSRRSKRSKRSQRSQRSQRSETDSEVLFKKL